MATPPAGSFALLTIVFTIGLAVVLSVSFRTDVAANWDTYKCNPGVIPIAGAFKPATDARTDAEFATANAAECQKEYIQDAIRLASEAPAAMARITAATVGDATSVVDVTGDMFFDLWNFCHEAYSTFMDNMRGAARLFTNFLQQMYGMVDRLQGSILSIVFALMSLISALISSLQLAVVVATVVTGILLSLMILLFFLIAPISGLLISMTAIISVVVISVGTAIAAATVEQFAVPGACFVPGTQVRLANGETQAIETLPIGTRLAEGGWVTAIHEFAMGRTTEIFDLYGVGVTGDHLVETEGGRLIPVCEHPDARPGPERPDRLWCLTTSARRIPCVGRDSSVSFADWEEIPEREYSALRKWYQRVWHTLNGEAEAQTHVPSDDLLDIEAGLDADCPVLVYGPKSGWLGTGSSRSVPVKHVQVGDLVWDGSEFTRVLGRVRMEGGMDVDIVNVCARVNVTAGVWMKTQATWSLVGSQSSVIRTDQHAQTFYHLYTASGRFAIGGREMIQVRDASDVGLEHLAPLVKDIVLHK